MTSITLCVSLLFLWNLSMLDKVSTKSVYESKQEHLKTTNSRKDLDAYLTKYGYIPCKNVYESNKNKEAKIICRPDLTAMIKATGTYIDNNITIK